MLKYLSHASILKCSHGGTVQFVPPPSRSYYIKQRPILTEPDLLKAFIIGCPQVGPGLKPCTKVVRVMIGKAVDIRTDSEVPLLESLKALTDGSPPGICMAVSHGGSNSEILGLGFGGSQVATMRAARSVGAPFTKTDCERHAASKRVDSKNWWQSHVEDPVADAVDYGRDAIPEGPLRTLRDIGVGSVQGVYGVAKEIPGLVGGVLDLLKAGGKFAGKLFTDPETREQTYASAVSLAKDASVAVAGTPEEQADLAERVGSFGKGVSDSIGQQITDEWTEAAKEGKQAELVSRWATHGGLDIASFFVGVGEVKAALSGAKGAAEVGEVARIAKVAEEVEGAAKATRVMTAAEEAKAAVSAAGGAAEAGPAVKAGKLSKAVRPAEEVCVKCRKADQDLQKFADKFNGDNGARETFLANRQFGASAQNLRVEGKSIQQLRDELPKDGYKRFATKFSPDGNRHDIFVHPDGSMVRLRLNDSINGPVVVKEVLKEGGNPMVPKDVAFKWSNDGGPLPRTMDDIPIIDEDPAV